jgi:rsbT antagonist protein RsbS
MAERIPIIQFRDFLLVSIQVEVHDRLVLTLQNDLAEAISKTGVHGVLIDISVVEIVDSFVGRTLANVAAVGQLLGANTVIVGIQPAIAITLVELGLTLDGVQTALDTESGLKQVHKLAPSVIFLDLNMPQTSGIDAIRHTNIPVIIYTGRKLTVQERDSLLTSGVVAVLSKLNTTQMQIQEVLNQIANV